MDVLPRAAFSGQHTAGKLSEPEFEGFYRRHAGALRAYILRISGDPSLADDLFQKSFMRFLEASLPPMSEPQMRSYLFRIATNTMLDHRRRLRHEADLLLDPALPIEPDAVLRTDMARLFARLEPRERAILWLAHVEEYTHEQIAPMIGVKEKSVRVLLFRARKKLASMLEAADTNRGEK